MKTLKNGLALAAVLALASGLSVAANAISVSFSDTIPVTTTNWNLNFVLPDFNSNLGTLDSISYLLTGVGDQAAKVESLDAAPSHIVVNYGIALVANNPGGPLTLNLTSTDTFDATAFDGTIDFGGTSGKTFAPVNLSGSAGPVTIVSGLGAYEDPGGVNTYSFGATGNGAFSASGAGNLITQVQTEAGATIKVTYNYHTNDVPEPSSLALVGMGLVSGVAILRRRRNVK